MPSFRLKDMTKYEKKICILLGLTAIVNPYGSMLPIVINYNPAHRCRFEEDLMKANETLFQMVYVLVYI